MRTGRMDMVWTGPGGAWCGTVCGCGTGWSEDRTDGHGVDRTGGVVWHGVWLWDGTDDGRCWMADRHDVTDVCLAGAPIMRGPV